MKKKPKEKKIGLEEIPMIVRFERFYNECFDSVLGTFNYELFGEQVFKYLKNLGLKKFNHE